ncbi:MAG: hypothetical protein QG636_112 [Patescibacteria group bacterium]|nr:hypothetical protein [Patescibacteria group bacterium]
MSATKYDGRDLEAMSFAKNYHEWILAMFRPFLRGKVAEVGAGSGSFSELLLEESIAELVAIEPSDDMYRLLVDETKHDERVQTYNGFFSGIGAERPSYFDTVVYVNVLEHVEDDRGELIAVFEALRPGGHLCIFVPALPWLYSAHDASIGHHRRYLKGLLVASARSIGFEIVEARYFDFFGIVPWFVLMTLLKTKPGAGKVAFYDRLVVPVARMIESLVTPPIGKNVLLVVRKPEG